MAESRPICGLYLFAVGMVWHGFRIGTVIIENHAAAIDPSHAPFGQIQRFKILQPALFHGKRNTGQIDVNIFPKILYRIPTQNSDVQQECRKQRSRRYRDHGKKNSSSHTVPFRIG